MREYKFSLTRIFPYNGRIYDSAPIRENTVQRKPALFTHILRSGDNHSDEKKTIYLLQINATFTTISRAQADNITNQKRERNSYKTKPYIRHREHMCQ